jgi:hypothetical protein
MVSEVVTAEEGRRERERELALIIFPHPFALSLSFRGAMRRKRLATQGAAIDNNMKANKG